MVSQKDLIAKIAKIGPRVASETILAIFMADALTAALVAICLGANPSESLTVGSFWRFSLTIATCVTAVVTPIFGATMAIMFSNLRDARDELTRISQKDPLTGLLNRRGFDSAMTLAFAEARRSHTSIAALMCDIDFFKIINDNYGHEFGDKILKEVAEVIRASIGAREALLGRHGGEEFSILLPGTAAEEAAEIAEALRVSCASHVFNDQERCVRITLSIGVATQTPREAEIRALIGRADDALYLAKQEGRNRVAQIGMRSARRAQFA